MTGEFYATVERLQAESAATLAELEAAKAEMPEAMEERIGMKENPYRCDDYEEPEPPSAEEIAAVKQQIESERDEAWNKLAADRADLLRENEAMKRERNSQLVDLRAVVANRCKENPYDWETDWQRHQMWLIVHGGEH